MSCICGGSTLIDQFVDSYIVPFAAYPRSVLHHKRERPRGDPGRSTRLLGGLYEKRGAGRWPDRITIIIKFPHAGEMLPPRNLAFQ